MRCSWADRWPTSRHDSWRSPTPWSSSTRTARRFVSRGGEKLDAALDRFAVDVSGRRCLDAGASTGGFTDCLLRHGAPPVVAVDVGHGQLDPSLRDDPRVEVLERTNVRSLDARALAGGAFDVVVADLSFISLVTVAPVLAGDLAATRRRHRRPRETPVRGGPGRGEPGQRGRSATRPCAAAALEKVASAFASQGATIMGAMASPLLGPAGNAEFLLHARARGGRHRHGHAHGGRDLGARARRGRRRSPRRADVADAARRGDTATDVGPTPEAG